MPSRLHDLTVEQLENIRRYHEQRLAATCCGDRQRRARVSIERIDRELGKRTSVPLRKGEP